MVASFTPTPEMIDEIHSWYQRQLSGRISRPIVPHLQERFGLDPAQAVSVIRAARKGGDDASH